ncbi:ImmA/IrrE family metallo-endopeptidase [Butyricicoccus pullicaecorum]|uniref:ImmA/IrrE family metallo-endopeptidase n=1 Tax=Butyricicoccus pullicaecorum TaxID=501571 RepID=UPI0013A66343|nr:ImmA/IrrE family metallo-endopeptidase [Butyricicoccus pullicaecorum]
MKTLVTNAELEQVGEGLIRKYMGEKHPPPRCVDIEGFISDYLRLSIVYASIAETDRDKIGFLSDGRYPLKVYENGRTVERVFPAGTVVIDRYLLREDRSGQRRFTLAHEAAHLIFERMSPLAPGPCFNRYFDAEQNYSISELRERFNLCETQTDRLASVLLMPRFLTERTLAEHTDGRPIPVYGSGVITSRDKVTVQTMANAMGVSFSALLNRLRELGRLDYRNISEYIESEMCFGGGL